MSLTLRIACVECGDDEEVDIDEGQIAWTDSFGGEWTENEDGDYVCEWCSGKSTWPEVAAPLAGHPNPARALPPPARQEQGQWDGRLSGWPTVAPTGEPAYSGETCPACGHVHGGPR
jgi:hypothetical protein